MLCLAHSGVGHKLGTSVGVVRCWGAPALVQVGGPGLGSSAPSSGWGRHLWPLWTVPPRTGPSTPSRKCLETRQVCWLLHGSPEQARLSVTFPATMAHCGGQTPGRHPLSAYAFSLSGTWPKLPLWPEQEVGVTWYPRAGASAPAALLGGTRPTSPVEQTHPTHQGGQKGPGVHPSRLEGLAGLP